MPRAIRIVALLSALTLPIAGLAAGSAAAKPKPKPKATPQIVITCSPNPVVETGNSIVISVCQVEANPTLAGKPVTISSTQLGSRCSAGIFVVLNPAVASDSITLPLDNDGNATVVAEGLNCAPGSALIDASLDAPPFATAITKLAMEPPQVTPPGLHAFPNPEVEVGDLPFPIAPPAGPKFNSASEAYFVFYVETSPVFAEQMVSLTSDQFTERCGAGVFLINFSGGGTGHGKFLALGPSSGDVILGTIDNDGNSAFVFIGSSCAAGKSTAIAEVQANGPTYSTQFNILPPAVTI